MVYGNINCAISRLQIKDGDPCLVIPLGFRIGGSFEKTVNDAGINNFMMPYFIAGEPKEVVFGGNYSVLNELDAKRGLSITDRFELYSIVHLGFYNEVTKWLDTAKEDNMWRTSNYISSSGSYSVYLVELWERMAAERRLKAVYETKNFDYSKVLPIWIAKINYFVWWCAKLQAYLYPNVGIDQDGCNADFVEIIKRLQSES